MDALVICQYEEDPVKIEALECSQHYTLFFRHARADNSGVGGGIWPTFTLI